MNAARNSGRLAAVLASTVQELAAPLTRTSLGLPGAPRDELARALAYAILVRIWDERCAGYQSREIWPRTASSRLRALFERAQSGRVGARLRPVLERLAGMLRSWEDEGPFASRDAAPAQRALSDFYEPFLRACDPAIRKSRGVYVTPPPLVSFMVHGVDTLLRRDFAAPLGLADATRQGSGPQPDAFRIRILDPATGSGVFLSEVIRCVFATFEQQAPPHQGWRQYVHDALLPRLVGLDCLFSAHVIGTLSIERALESTGAWPDDDALDLRWTNALEPDEARMPASVILGNPPYANTGQGNNGPWILGLLDEYRRGLDERKLNLNDDYIKFFRRAQHDIARNGSGLIALVTSDSYLEAPTRRGMRASLLRDFSNIHVLDLGGSRFRDRPGDENIFSIQQGVAVAFLSRPAAKAPTQLRYARLQGLRSDKLGTLAQNGFAMLPWRPAPCVGPAWSFRPGSADHGAEYERFLSLTEIFELSGSGIKTDRDRLCYDRSRDRLATRMQTAFAEAGDASFRERFRIHDTSSYDLCRRLARGRFDPAALRRCNYRPFDSRWLYYEPGFTSRPARRVMRHMSASNIALIAKRQARDESYSWVFSARGLVADGLFAIDNKGREQIFPLMLEGEDPPRPNLRPSAVEAFSRALGAHFEPASETPALLTPHSLLAYIYAVLHAPTYRTRYREPLRTDYPRVPLPHSAALFAALQGSGRRLLDLHCDGELSGAARPSSIPGSPPLEIRAGYPRFAAGRVFIDRDTAIAELPEELWKFRIGGHKVAEKWLKDRRADGLDAGALEGYQGLTEVLAETRSLMMRIDELIDARGGWPDAFARTGSDA